MQESLKETVILVHGTWAAPLDHTARWYSLGADANGFVSKLDAALQTRGSPARCWAHCSEDCEPFHWSGENTWVARTRGADGLGDYIQSLRKSGWICHIVAHSHGGNVVIEALPKIGTAGANDEPLGKLVTLGTPFLDVTTPVLERDRERRLTLLGLGIMLIALQPLGLWGSWDLVSRAPLIFFFSSSLMIAILLIVLIFRWRKRVAQDISAHLRHHWTYVITEILFWAMVAALLELAVINPPYPEKAIACLAGGFVALALMLAWRRNRMRSTVRGFPRGNSEAHWAKPQLLALGSRVDEAWQLLFHLGASGNPLEAKMGFFRYLASSFTSSLAQREAADRLYYSPLGKVGLGSVISAIVAYSVLLLTVHSNLQNMNLKGWRLFESVVANCGVSAILFVVLFGDRFLAAFLFPLRWTGRVIGAVTGTIAAIGTYLVRRAAWPVMLRMAMGLEGYQFPIPPVQQWPRHIEGLAIYEDIPADAEKIALDGRGAWIAKHLASVSETFAKMTVTGVDVLALFQTIEADQTLVHAAYYTNDACIDRIADWIADKR